MAKEYERAIAESMEAVPQSKPENELQVANNAGGFTFTVTPQVQLERFLILGTTGGTYYVKEQDLTKQNMDWLISSISVAGDGGLWILRSVVDVSTNGRAYRNSAAIFTLALLFKYAPPVLKSSLKTALPLVCRTAMHLYEFCKYIEQMGAWGRAKREAVGSWFTGKTADQLAYQAVKYRQRDGWTLRDVMRKVHPPYNADGRPGIDHNLGKFILGKETEGQVPPIIAGFRSIQEQTDIKHVLEHLHLFPELPWEAIPTEFLTHPDVWKKLFYNGQLKGQALVRNITRLARIGAFNDMMFARAVADMLTDEEMIRRTKLHPMQYLNAMVVYTDGQIDRRYHNLYSSVRQKNWEVTPVIRDALNTGFYLAFKYVEPAGKRTMLALDVSGSMQMFPASGVDLSCSQVSGAMAMTIARSEPYYDVMAFDTGFRPLDISPNMHLDQVMHNIAINNAGGTDCSVPMTWASSHQHEIDTFVVLTDNETWAGRVHPHVALQNYRNQTGIDAKLIVVGMTATEFTIADPRDRGMLDVVGCDSNLPKLVAEFSAGRI